MAEFIRIKQTPPLQIFSVLKKQESQKKVKNVVLRFMVKFYKTRLMREYNIIGEIYTFIYMLASLKKTRLVIFLVSKLFAIGKKLASKEIPFSENFGFYENI